MDTSETSFEQSVLTRLPLADAVMTIARHVLEPTVLNELYEENRGASYQKSLSFAEMVELIRHALIGPKKSLRAHLDAAAEAQTLSATPRAVYDKLSRMPIAASQALLCQCTDRLRRLVPTETVSPNIPASMAHFSVVLLDGKLIKHVPRRLRPLRLDRVNASTLLGGRALAAYELNSGMVLGFHSHPDGEANDVKFVPEVLSMLECREGLRRPLYVCDSAFGTVMQAQRMAERGDFIMRLHGGTSFIRDESVPVLVGEDRFGRETRDESGWVVRLGDGVRMPVRRISVERDLEPLKVITSLMDRERYPANDILELYLHRWQIETMFQEETEVFDLRRLIGTTPKAMLFQMALCMLIYNVIRVVKHYVADAGKQKVEDVSSEKLFGDVNEEMTAAYKLIPEPELYELIREFDSPIDLVEWLRARLAPCWKKIWLKAKREPRDPSRPIPPRPLKIRQTKCHDSVHRILERQQT